MNPPGYRDAAVILIDHTLDDIVNRLRAIDTGLLIGTYSGQGGRYVDPRTRDWVGVERRIGRIDRIGPLRQWGALDADYTYKPGR